MSEPVSRRDVLHNVVKGSVLATFGGGALLLVQKAHGQVVWQVDASRCINSRLGDTGAEACKLCTTECVGALSAVRAVNEYRSKERRVGKERRFRWAPHHSKNTTHP